MDVSDLLSKTADLCEENFWQSGVYNEDLSKPVGHCVITGICAVRGSIDDLPEYLEALERILRAAKIQVSGDQCGVDAITTWSDSTPKAQVVATLREAAAG